MMAVPPLAASLAASWRPLWEEHGNFHAFAETLLGQLRHCPFGGRYLAGEPP